MNARAVAEAFADIDQAEMERLGSAKVTSIDKDLHNQKFSIKDVAEKNEVSMGTVVQVARYHRFDAVTLEDL